MFFIYPMVFLTIICLFYLVYEDLRTREINTIPIYILSGIGLIYNLYFGFLYNFWKLYILQLLIVLIFLIIIYLLGKITIYAYIGEGDLLTIMMISFTSGYSVLFSEFVFLLALFFMLFIPLIFLVYNLLKKNYPSKKINNRFSLMFLGFPVSVSKLNNFFTPLEEYKLKDGKIENSILIKPNCDSEIQIQKIKEIAIQYNIKKIWASPLIPFVWPIFIAYLLLLFFLILSKLNFFGFFATLFI
ncbi:MAG TPA: A24 family peptidase C-terminal domain-containing protein [archaeon]|nr:A24 family peptidase C-terminal domain-containing protein [archaeon]